VTLKFTDRPYGGHGSKQDDWRTRFPADARPIASAPISAQPILVYEANGAAHWALHHNNSWRELKPYKDFRDGSVQWRMDNQISNPVAWAMPRRSK
jgi:hypothetical protein